MNNLEKFVKLFTEYNEHTNLMSKNDVQKLESKHIADCLAINLFFDKYGKDVKNLIDIGTGGGLPAIPIAARYQNLDVFALDSTEKKIKFINLVKEELNITNLHPYCERAENFEKREYFDLAVSRAVAPLSTVLEYCSPFVKKDGYIVAYKAKTAEEELQNAQNAQKILKLSFIEKLSYNISSEEDCQHCLLVFKKNDKTPKKYPRKNNLARKSPL